MILRHYIYIQRFLYNDKNLKKDLIDYYIKWKFRRFNKDFVIIYKNIRIKDFETTYPFSWKGYAIFKLYRTINRTERFNLKKVIFLTNRNWAKKQYFHI